MSTVHIPTNHQIQSTPPPPSPIVRPIHHVPYQVIESSNHQRPSTTQPRPSSLTPNHSTSTRRRKLQYRRQTISVRPHIHIRIHALLPAEVGTIDQTPVAVLAGFRVQSDGSSVVANSCDALVVGALAARPGAFGQPFGGSGGAASWVLAGAVEAGYRGAHCLVRFWGFGFWVWVVRGSFFLGWLVGGGLGSERSIAFVGSCEVFDAQVNGRMNWVNG